MFVKNFLKQRKLSKRHKAVKAATFAIGLGVTVGVLIAPKSGKGLRKDILNKMTKATKTMKKTVEDVKDKVKSKIVHAAKVVEEKAKK